MSISCGKPISAIRSDASKPGLAASTTVDSGIGHGNRKYESNTPHAINIATVAFAIHVLLMNRRIQTADSQSTADTSSSKNRKLATSIGWDSRRWRPKLYNVRDHRAGTIDHPIQNTRKSGFACITLLSRVFKHVRFVVKQGKQSNGNRRDVSAKVKPLVVIA